MGGGCRAGSVRHHRVSVEHEAERLPTVVVNCQDSVVRGEEVGCFCKVADVSIVAAGSRVPYSRHLQL